MQSHCTHCSGGVPHKAGEHVQGCGSQGEGCVPSGVQCTLTFVYILYWGLPKYQYPIHIPHNAECMQRRPPAETTRGEWALNPL